MTDRDRLAADLMIPYIDAPEAADCALCGEPVRTESVREFADRLIALGWTRLDEADRFKHPRLGVFDAFRGRVLPKPIDPPPPPPPPPPSAHRLDEERLARALLATQGYTLDVHRHVYGDDVDILDAPHEWFDSARNHAAAIAKAYREDAE